MKWEHEEAFDGSGPWIISRVTHGDWSIEESDGGYLAVWFTYCTASEHVIGRYRWLWVARLACRWDACKRGAAFIREAIA